MDFLNKIFNKIGWSGLIIIILFIVLYSYSLLKRENRIKDAAYTKGVSLGVKSGVRGSLYLYYTFQLNDEKYNGNVTDDFCKKCLDCCTAGDTVIVRFQKGNPENNDLVTELPEGAILEAN